jgi:cell division transport system permease protein
VTEVDFSEDWLAQYKRVRQVLKIFGVMLLVGCLVGCSFIIANFMGMRHQSRKNEIDIVRLIGAHQNFILGPFLWEGLIEGLIGASFALSLLYVIKMSLATLISVQWSSLLGVHEWLYLSFSQLLALIGVGIAMAFCGGFTVFLRFRENNAR